ncbi:hypothetical protein [Armatimonas sp.]|uniref:hypothetical protein n=1 Tax=Armatimonas sp. TaxID=1872638 RepID=UPI00375288F8
MSDLYEGAELTLDENLDGLREWMKSLQEKWPEEPEEELFPPPVAEERVVAFERKYGFMLPEELRAIITQISDGLNLWLPLDEWESPPEVMGRWLKAENIALPFVPEEVYDCSYFPDEELETLENAPAYQAFENSFKQLQDVLVKGTLWLAGDLDLGCGYFLVVTGNTRGRLWKITQDVGMDASYTVRLVCLGSLFNAIENMEEEQ